MIPIEVKTMRSELFVRTRKKCENHNALVLEAKIVNRTLGMIKKGTEDKETTIILLLYKFRIQLYLKQCEPISKFAIYTLTRSQGK